MGKAKAVSSSKSVFISYSWDSDEHSKRVLDLSKRLEADGFDVRLDRSNKIAPPEGWLRWMRTQIKSASHVLLVCTEQYYDRFWGDKEEENGGGVNFEG